MKKTETVMFDPHRLVERQAIGFYFIFFTAVLLLKLIDAKAINDRCQFRICPESSSRASFNVQSLPPCVTSFAVIVPFYR